MRRARITPMAQAVVLLLGAVAVPLALADRPTRAAAATAPTAVAVAPQGAALDGPGRDRGRGGDDGSGTSGTSGTSGSGRGSGGDDRAAAGTAGGAAPGGAAPGGAARDGAAPGGAEDGGRAAERERAARAAPQATTGERAERQDQRQGAEALGGVETAAGSRPAGAGPRRGTGLAAAAAFLILALVVAGIRTRSRLSRVR